MERSQITIRRERLWKTIRKVIKKKFEIWNTIRKIIQKSLRLIIPIEAWSYIKYYD